MCAGCGKEGISGWLPKCEKSHGNLILNKLISKYKLKKKQPRSFFFFSHGNPMSSYEDTRWGQRPCVPGVLQIPLIPSNSLPRATFSVVFPIHPWALLPLMVGARRIPCPLGTLHSFLFSGSRKHPELLTSKDFPDLLQVKDDDTGLPLIKVTWSDIPICGKHVESQSTMLCLLALLGSILVTLSHGLISLEPVFKARTKLVSCKTVVGTNKVSQGEMVSVNWKHSIHRVWIDWEHPSSAWSLSAIITPWFTVY